MPSDTDDIDPSTLVATLVLGDVAPGANAAPLGGAVVAQTALVLPTTSCGSEG
jgi:hypothetical protein